MRFSLYLSPIVCLLFGLGAAVLLGIDERGRSRGPKPTLVVLALLVLIPCGSMARDFLQPYKTKDALRDRDFARWFWFVKGYDADLVCLDTDCGREFFAGRAHPAGMAPYLCNQRIYSPRRLSGDPLTWDELPSRRPLRCVRYKTDRPAYDEEVFAQWLAAMQSRYRLISGERHAFPIHRKHRELLCTHWLEVYEFADDSTDEAALAGG